MKSFLANSLTWAAVLAAIAVALVPADELLARAASLGVRAATPAPAPGPGGPPPGWDPAMLTPPGPG